jgi:hypothetical protein
MYFFMNKNVYFSYNLITYLANYVRVPNERPDAVLGHFLHSTQLSHQGGQPRDGPLRRLPNYDPIRHEFQNPG